MSTISQIKAHETKKLLLNLGEILDVLSKNEPLLNQSILQQKQCERESSYKENIMAEVEKLMSIYQIKQCGVHNPMSIVILHKSIKNYPPVALAEALMEFVNNKITRGNESISSSTPSFSPEEYESFNIDERQFEHIHSFNIVNDLISRVEELIRKRDELRSNINSTEVISRVKLIGLKAKRDFLKSKLLSLKSSEELLYSLKAQIKNSAQFSADFEKKYKENKNGLEHLNAYLKCVKKDAESNRSQVVHHQKEAFDSLSTLSMCLKELRSRTDGRSVSLASSAALSMLQCSTMPRLRIRENPPLFTEVCQRFGLCPLVTSLDKVRERIETLVKDHGTFGLLGDELGNMVSNMKKVHSQTKSFLEKSRGDEKALCVLIVKTLKKISGQCAKDSQERLRLERFWNHWCELSPDEGANDGEMA